MVSSGVTQCFTVQRNRSVRTVCCVYRTPIVAVLLSEISTCWVLPGSSPAQTHSRTIMMMGQRGVRFADGRLPVPPPPKEWVVPSFSSFKTPAPPPVVPGTWSNQQEERRLELPSPRQTVLGNTFSKTEVVDTVTDAITPHKNSGLPKIIETGEDTVDGQLFFASPSGMALLSPISAMTEITAQSLALNPFRRVSKETMEATKEESPTDASFETLATIDMLNFEFVGQCTNHKDLGRIIRVLTDHNKSKNAPAQLLQATRLRLQRVQGKVVPPPPPPPNTTQHTNSVLPVHRLASRPVPQPPPPPPPPPRMAVVQKLQPENVERTDQTLHAFPYHPLLSVTPSISSSIIGEKVDKGGQEKFDEEKEEKSIGRMNTESTPNRSRITVGNTTLESIDPSKSSLNFSYSPSSILRGLDIEDTPNRMGNEPSSLASTSLRDRLGTISETSTSAAAAPSSLYNERLSAEVERLSEDAVQMERQRTHEQSSFMQQLHSLRRSKKEAESMIRILQSKVEIISGEKSRALQTMHEIQHEQQQARKALFDEQARLQQRDQETREMEVRLQGKIAELQKALADEVERHRMTHNAEKSLRERTTSELQCQRERNVELNLLLRQTKENLERIKNTQEVFRSELLKTMGVDETEVSMRAIFEVYQYTDPTVTNSFHQYQNMPHSEFAQRILSRVEDVKAEKMKLSEDLKKAQSAPNVIVRERDQLRDRIREALRKNRTLEEDNAKLGSRIEELSEEVISSRALIDKLLRTSHETQVSDWERKETQYKAAIRNYQQQIREQASTVSLDLYMAAVDDGKRTQAQLQNASRKIVDLEKKLSSATKEGAPTPIGSKAKTPNPKKGLGTSFFSPTDYLEKGLLFRAFQNAPSPIVSLPLSAKKPSTPYNQVEMGFGLNLGRQTSSAKDRDNGRKYHGETTPHMHGETTPHTWAEPESTPGHLDQSVETKTQWELIGMTISFEQPIGGLPSPQKEDRTSMKEAGDTNDARQGSAVEKETKRSALGVFDAKKSALSPVWDGTPLDLKINVGSEAKENVPAFVSPTGASKTLRMKKTRELGGMKGLRNHLNKVRSPPNPATNQRVPLGERKVKN